MPIYTFKCPDCGKTLEKLLKTTKGIVFCDCLFVRSKVGGGNVELHPEMVLVLSVPSPAQWNCRRPT